MSACTCNNTTVAHVSLYLYNLFNTAVTETTSETLCKHRQKKIPWIAAEILDLCDKRREMRKKRFEPEGSEKYKEVNNNIKRCMKKAKENWIENSVVRLKKI